MSVELQTTKGKQVITNANETDNTWIPTESKMTKIKPCGLTIPKDLVSIASGPMQSKLA